MACVLRTVKPTRWLVKREMRGRREQHLTRGLREQHLTQGSQRRRELRPPKNNNKIFLWNSTGPQILPHASASLR